ncbi:MAG TPA: YfhO family protein, partial [Herpetosiphonaceae bacterium]|nr:YfhO family protein [Herpetosiphonaceae bacterium]
VAVLHGPILLGEVFLPLDLLAHFPPWRYSYERTAVANTAPSDLLLEYYPRRLIATQMLREGHLPLWNPYVLGGMPLLADGYSALLYPLSVLFVLFPVAYAFGWFALLHLMLAGLAAYWLARGLGLPPLPALLAGIGYMGNGFLMAWLLFPEFAAVAAWLPVAIGCVERYEQRAAAQISSGGYWLATAVVLALCVLCQLQLAFYVGGAAAIYWIGRRLLTAPRQLSGALIALVGVTALALMLSAAQWLPTVELALDSQRSGAVGNVASGLNLLQYVIPAAFGGPRPDAAPGQPQAIPLPSYVGLLPLLLAVVGGWNSRTPGRATLVLLGCCVLALLGMPPAVIQHIPLLNQLPGTDRWSMVLGLVLPLLAGFGLADLLGRRKVVDQAQGQRPTRLLWLSRALCVIVIVVLGGALLRHLGLFTPTSRYGSYITLLRRHLSVFPLLVIVSSLLLPVLMIGLNMVNAPSAHRWRALLGGLAIVVLALDLGWYGLPLQSSADPRQIFLPTTDLLGALGTGAVDRHLSGDMVYPPTRTTAFLGQDRDLYRVFAADYPSFQPNLPSAFGFQDPRGYASLFSKRYLQFARAWEGKQSDDPGWVSVYLTEAYQARHLLDLMGVRYVVFNPQSPNEQQYRGLELLQRNDEGAIYRNPTALPRAFLVHSVEVIPDENALLARLVAPDFPVSRTVLLAEPAPALQPPPAGSREGAIVTQYTPNEVKVTVQAPAPAILILSDTLYEGWHAQVDGQAAKLYAANHILRGVAVPEGTHEVRLYYRPLSFMIGTGTSAMGLLVSVAGMAWLGRGALRLRRSRSRVSMTA